MCTCVVSFCVYIWFNRFRHYDVLQVNLVKVGEDGDISNYINNSEWKLVKLHAERNVVYYSCCAEPYPDVTYTIQMRRKPLFYVFNMIMPCMLITLVALLGFYIPSDSGEKVTMGITTLLSMTVFLMLVAENMPPTSDVLPLVGKWPGRVLDKNHQASLWYVMRQERHQCDWKKKTPQKPRTVTGEKQSSGFGCWSGYGWSVAQSKGTPLVASCVGVACANCLGSELQFCAQVESFWQTQLRNKRKNIHWQQMRQQFHPVRLSEAKTHQESFPVFSLNLVLAVDQLHPWLLICMVLCFCEESTFTATRSFMHGGGVPASDMKAFHTTWNMHSFSQCEESKYPTFFTGLKTD